MKTRLLRYDGATRRDAAVDAWFERPAPALAALALRWFDEMRGCGDDVRELLHDGHPTACIGDAGFGEVNAFRDHVNVAFFRAVDLPDPAGLLEGTGRFMRHVKLFPDRVIDEAALRALVLAAYRDMRARVAAEASA